MTFGDIFLQTAGLVMEQETILQQSVVALMSYVQSELTRRIPDHTLTLFLYGSLHHGLYIDKHSKICIDLQLHPLDPPVEQRLLTMLYTEMRNTDHPRVADPALLLHGTVHRPVILEFQWDNRTVNVTIGNIIAVRTSHFIRTILQRYPLIRLVLLHLKERLRAETRFLGPHVGQISMYALFTIVYHYIEHVLGKIHSFADINSTVHTILIAWLKAIPGKMEVGDIHNPEHNLTKKSFLAPQLAKWLEINKMNEA